MLVQAMRRAQAETVLSSLRVRGPSVHPDQLLGGRYRIRARVGGGGMGDVYEANDERLGRRVAIKVLHVDRADDPGELKRFEREAHAHATLSHPNIVQVSDS